MSGYRRSYVPGGTFFFTVVTFARRTFLCEEKARRFLRTAFTEVRCDAPFEIPAFVLLPEHLHCIWTLPEEDSDYSKRWGRIKKAFTDRWLEAGGCEGERSEARRARHDRGVWQYRFWEHTIRDQEDYSRHLDYIHYNPVKHGLARCPHIWEYSSFHRYVSSGEYAPDWQCVCEGTEPEPPDFTGLDTTAIE